MNFQDWAKYLTYGVGPVRPSLIAGNWKCNGTNKLVDEIVSSLNDVGEYPTHTEVVIAVPGIYFDSL